MTCHTKTPLTMRRSSLSARTVNPLETRFLHWTSGLEVRSCQIILMFIVLIIAKFSVMMVVPVTVRSQCTTHIARRTLDKESGL